MKNLSHRDVVVTCMAKSVLAGVALCNWNVGNAREVVDECMGHVESRELAAEFWRSTKKGYYANPTLDALLYVGTSDIPGMSMRVRHILAFDGNVEVTSLESLSSEHVAALRLIGAEDLLPLAAKVYECNKEIEKRL